MPPRKKRGVTRRGSRGRPKKMEPSPTTSTEEPNERFEEPTSPAEESSSIDTPPTETLATYQVKNHKSFGKYRYLHDNSNNTKSGESETEDVVFVIEETDDDNQHDDDDDDAHYMHEDVIVYDNSEVIETTGEEIQYEVAADQEDVVTVQEQCDESPKSTESMFEVMCIVEDDSSATASAQNSENIASGGDDVLSNGDDEKTKQMPVEVQDTESDMYILTNAESAKLPAENNDLKDVNLVDDIIEVNPTEYFSNTSEIIEKDPLENNLEVISYDNDSNVKQKTELDTLNDANKSNSSSEHCATVTEMDAGVLCDLDIKQPEYANVEMTTQCLQVLLSKIDLVVDVTADKLQGISLSEVQEVVKTQEMDVSVADEEPLSASKILKKKGRPRKVQESAKSSPRKSKKVNIEDGEEQDDGASAFVKALELADKAAKKKIAKQKEAKAKKIDRAKKSKQLNRANKKAAALLTTDRPDDDDDNNIRRSSRIKTITNIKKASRGKGLVKSKSLQDLDTSDNSNSAFADIAPRHCQDSPTFASPTIESGSVDPTPLKPVKVKSRWRRSSELEMIQHTVSSLSRSSSFGADSGISVSAEHLPERMTSVQNEEREADNKLEVERRLKQFVHLKENQYLTERISCKEAKKMTCDCFLTDDEIGRGEMGCGDDCLNRLLMIECGSLCAVGGRCTNKRFQTAQFAPCEAFNTEKKGLGIRAAANIPYGEFILEYIGEVLDPDKFDSRAAEYSQDKNRHYYFMALRADAIIDATQKGNVSRFINHSCDPNAETQKWTVNGELRIGFFSKRTILAGEEITFDYQFQRYGKEAQKCFCDAANCRGWLGEEPDDGDEDEDDDDDDEDGDEAKKEPKREISDESPKKELKKRVLKKERVKQKPRKEFFEDLDLDVEIETLQTTGLKNQAHTLKLSRLMVRSKEPAQRTKLLRLLRRGEFPCRRLFLDYHGLRLIHGWMTDAQQLAKIDHKMESLRLEILQTIATLPIPNKTMLQDSKVLSTVEKWSTAGNTSPEDSESNSPKDPEDGAVKTEEIDIKTIEIKQETPELSKITTNLLDTLDDIRHSVGMADLSTSTEKSSQTIKNKSIVEELADMFSDDEDMDISPPPDDSEDDPIKPNPTKDPSVKIDPIKVEGAYNIVTEIVALAQKLLEEWAGLKVVFRIPKRERIEQMKEHERQANKDVCGGGGGGGGRGGSALGEGEGGERRLDSGRYRHLQGKVGYHVVSGYKGADDRMMARKDDIRGTYESKPPRGGAVGGYSPRITKLERRKQFTLLLEQEEGERRRRQRELWHQHEQHCLLMGTDPRFTAPYDPARGAGYHCIWNPATGQWQNYATPPLGGGTTVNTYQTVPMVLPALPYQENVQEMTADVTKVMFMGPIPPPAQLPPKWKSAKDKYSRPYYYHIRVRKAQWEPPPINNEADIEESASTTSSSDTSSLSSTSSSEDSDTDDETSDTKLLIEIRNKFNRMDAQKRLEQEKQQRLEMMKAEKLAQSKILADVKRAEPTTPPTPINTEEDSMDEMGVGVGAGEEAKADWEDVESTEAAGEVSSLDERLMGELAFLKQAEEAPTKKKRPGLVKEYIISPRSEKDKQQFREDLKKYKENKEMLRKQKEMILEKSKQRKSTSTKHKLTKHKTKKTIKLLKLKKIPDANSESVKKIKETFRSAMATVMVAILNSYRKPDCPFGRIGNTDDFKHLARKLTHFVMLKELKHCKSIEDLVCTDSVKAKAKEFVRKYMFKFGEIYVRPKDDIDTYL